MRYSKFLLIISIAMLLVFVGCSEDTDKESEVSGNKDNNVNVNNEDNTNNTDDRQEATIESVYETGLPIIDWDAALSLDFFVGQTPETNDNWNDVMIFNKYAELTNMDVNFDMVPYEELEERRNLVLEGDSLPDAFHSADIPISDISKYGQQGVFIPLNDLIEEYAPNFQKILDSYPEVKNAVTHPDGNIYALPTIDEPYFFAKRVNAMLWYRDDWLNTLGMDVPETPDEFYEFLKAVKESDVAGDGPGDVVPFGATNIDFLLDGLKGLYGVGMRGVNVGNIDYDSLQLELRYYPISDEYKEILMFVNKLYEEELIEQNIFEIESDEYFANADDGVYASTYIQNPTSLLTSENKDEYVAAIPFESQLAGGNFSNINHLVVNHGSFAITNANEHPEATIRWIDHFYGEEGSELFFMGIYDETFDYADGGYQYIEDIQNNPDGLSIEESAAKYLTWPGGMYPGMTMQRYFESIDGWDMAIEAAEEIEPHLVNEVWPEFIYTEEENEDLKSFGADIENHTADMQKKFITGEASFDEWDNFVETIESMNLDRYMEIQEDAYERYRVGPNTRY